MRADEGKQDMSKKAKTLAPTSKEQRGKRSNCRCTRCGAFSKHLKGELKRAGGVRCVCCGGNVISARMVYDGDLDQEYRSIVSAPAVAPVKQWTKSSEERTREFMELVDCEAHEVKDTPERKPAPRPLSRAGCTIGGDTKMPWGKYKGQALKWVPRHYLQYIASAKDDSAKATPGSLKFKHELRRYLSAV